MMPLVDRFIVILSLTFKEGEGKRLGIPERDRVARNALNRQIDRFVWDNWDWFLERVGRENRSLQEVFEEEWTAFLTRH